jgi:tetratricopeptide (TPR) repeat protein
MSDAVYGDEFDQVMTNLESGGRWDLILRLARQRLASLPECPDAHRWAGWGALETGDLEAAAWHAAQLQFHEPEQASTFRLWAELHFVQSRWDEARTCLEEAIARWPDNPQYHQMLAYVHMERNDESAAISSSEQALHLDPEYVPARFSLNLLKYHRSWRRADLMEEQIAELLQLLRDDPSNSAILAEIGEIHLMRLNSPKAALPFLQQAMANSPSDERIERLYHMARCLAIPPDFTFQNATPCAATADAMTSHVAVGIEPWSSVSLTTGVAAAASTYWIDTLAADVDANSSIWTAETVEELLIS